MNSYLSVLFDLIFEIWAFFKSLFFDWPAVVLVITLLWLFLFKDQIRQILFNLSKENANNEKDIIKNPYIKKRKILYIVIQIISPLIAIIALIFSIYSYNQMLMINEPRISFSEPELLESNELIYILTNLGGTETNNVKIKLSTCDELNCPFTLFDDELLNTLDPNIPHRFGFSNIPEELINKIKISPLLIVDLEYNNPFKNKPLKRTFYYLWLKDVGLISVLKKDVCQKARKVGGEIEKNLSFC